MARIKTGLPNAINLDEQFLDLIGSTVAAAVAPRCGHFLCHHQPQFSHHESTSPHIAIQHLHGCSKNKRAQHTQHHGQHVWHVAHVYIFIRALLSHFIKIMNNGTRKELWIGFALFQFLLNIVYYSTDCCGVAVDGGTHSMCPRGLWYLPQLVDNLFIGTKSIPGQLNWRVDKFIKFFVTYLDRPTNSPAAAGNGHQQRELCKPLSKYLDRVNGIHTPYPE